MKIAIVGSRNTNEFIVYKYLTEHIPENTTEIITGGAKGTDSVAIKFAKDNHIKLTLFLPDYRRYKKGAPIIRNALIAEYSDAAIIFWDGNSRGTKNIINCFSEKNKPFTIIYT